MQRYISTITRKFTNLLGINNRDSLTRIGVTATASVFHAFMRSLGLRLGGGTSSAGSYMIQMSCMHSARAVAVTVPVLKRTGKRVQRCWRPAGLAWRDSGLNNV